MSELVYRLAPVHTSLFPDPEFDRKADRIRTAADQAQQ